MKKKPIEATYVSPDTIERIVVELGNEALSYYDQDYRELVKQAAKADLQRLEQLTDEIAGDRRT